MQYNKFFLFNLIHSFVLIFSLSRSISTGLITYHATQNPNELGFFAASFSLGSFLGYYLVKLIKENYKSISYTSMFEGAQLGFIFSSIFLIIYLYFSQINNNWGNYFIWSCYSFFVGACISLEIRVKNYMLKEHFENNSFSSIVKYDFLILGIGKFFGFSTGYFINSANMIYFFVFLSILTNLLLFLYIKKLPQIKTIENKTNIIKNKRLNISFQNTLLLGFTVNFLIFPIGSQAVTYAKIWGYNFYIYLVFSALGGIIFNLLIGNRQMILMKKKYLISLIMFITSLIFLISEIKELTLISLFLYGCSLFLFNSLAQARMYEESLKNHSLADKYFPTVSIANILGSYFYGKMLSINHQNTFIFLSIISLMMFLFIYKKGKFESN